MDNCRTCDRSIATEADHKSLSEHFKDCSHEVFCPFLSTVCFYPGGPECRTQRVDWRARAIAAEQRVREFEEAANAPR